MNNYLSKINRSFANDEFTSDSAAKGAYSRCLKNEEVRMRIMLYPAGFKSDHTCYKGHALYILSGTVKIYIEEEVTTWSKGDAFIIPDDVPHVVCNEEKEDAKVIVVDNG